MNTITPPPSRRILPSISLFFYGMAAYIVALISFIAFHILGLNFLIALLALLALFIGAILLIISSVFYYINTYRVWREINSLKPWLSPEDAKKVPSPGTAIALLFIPLFNFYWIFIAVGKIPYYFNKAYQGEQEINPSPFKKFCICLVSFFLINLLSEVIIPVLLGFIDPLQFGLIFGLPIFGLLITLIIFFGLLIALCIFFVKHQLLYKRIMAIREQGDPSRDLTS